MKKVLLLGSQHGNEPLGDLLEQHIRKYSPQLLPYLTFKTANLKAKRQGIRFVESDMNRSYDGSSKTYESRRAKQISHFIRTERFDLVLDLHTTNCVQPPSILIHKLSLEKRNFLRASHVENVVDMKHDIVQNSLIGRHVNSLSIEVSNRDLNDTVLDALTHDIERYLNGGVFGQTKKLYVVRELLLKKEVPKKMQFVNFQPTSAGFVPILTGENSYKKDTDYLGFKSEPAVHIKI